MLAHSKGDYQTQLFAICNRSLTSLANKPFKHRRRLYVPHTTFLVESVELKAYCQMNTLAHSVFMWLKTLASYPGRIGFLSLV